MKIFFLEILRRPISNLFKNVQLLYFILEQLLYLKYIFIKTSVKLTTKI